MMYWMETQLIVGLNGKQQSASCKDWGGGCCKEKAIYSHQAETSTQFSVFFFLKYVNLLLTSALIKLSERS